MDLTSEQKERIEEEERYRAEVRANLDRPATDPRKMRMALIAAVLFLVIAGVVGWFMWQHKVEAERTAGARVAAAEQIR